MNTRMLDFEVTFYFTGYATFWDPLRATMKNDGDAAVRMLVAGLGPCEAGEADSSEGQCTVHVRPTIKDRAAWDRVDEYDQGSKDALRQPVKARHDGDPPPGAVGVTGKPR